MLEFIPGGINRALEIGCGEGNFGACLKNSLNIEVWGIELESEAANRANAKIDKVLVGDRHKKGIDHLIPELAAHLQLIL